MTLIAMAVWDTEENNRWELTQATILSLYDTVDFERHRLIIVDNASCPNTQEVFTEWEKAFKRYKNQQALQIIHLPQNIGTARAINKAWLQRQPGENAVKMDNDVVIHQQGWVDILDDCIQREPRIGIVGLKRKDCIETPWHPDSWYRSRIEMLPHELGQPWRIVEHVHHVMGTCQMYSAACLEKIGYLYQMGGLYGFDDALASIRAQVAGFYTVHYPAIEIDHIDPGVGEYQSWKQRYSGRLMAKFNAVGNAYTLGHLSVYHGPDDL